MQAGPGSHKEEQFPDFFFFFNNQKQPSGGSVKVIRLSTSHGLMLLQGAHNPLKEVLPAENWSIADPLLISPVCQKCLFKKSLKNTEKFRDTDTIVCQANCCLTG